MNALLDEYQKQLLKRDELQKEANEYAKNYFAIFGELMIEIFKLKIECIKLKKQIAYCQKCKNKKQAINIDVMNDSIELLMNEYYQTLNDYIENYDNLKKS